MRVALACALELILEYYDHGIYLVSDENFFIRKQEAHSSIEYCICETNYCCTVCLRI